MRCKKCLSTNVERNDRDSKHLEHTAKHGAVHGVTHAVHGHPAMLGMAAAGWLVAKLIQSTSHTWCCKACGHQFS